VSQPQVEDAVIAAVCDAPIDVVSAAWDELERRKQVDALVRDAVEYALAWQWLQSNPTVEAASDRRRSHARLLASVRAFVGAQL
jgi:hypothetical protein